MHGKIHLRMVKNINTRIENQKIDVKERKSRKYFIQKLKITYCQIFMLKSNTLCDIWERYICSWSQYKFSLSVINDNNVCKMLLKCKHISAILKGYFFLNFEGSVKVAGSF